MAEVSSQNKSTRESCPGRGVGSEVESILARYSHDEQRKILHNLEVLASTAQFIGQDFGMKVLLNRPGGGWHWNFERNEVRVDPETILNAPLDVTKAIYAHEGFHRRITPKDGVPSAEWQEPGLPFLVNSIEDPRIENFGGEAYPAYRPLRDASYRYHTAEAETAAVATLGKVPRHVRAGLELINQWFREAEGKAFEIPDSLDPAVHSFLQSALPHAQDAWLRYPSRTEADWEPDKIGQYFEASYRIIREKVWPEFQKLYELDKHEQMLDEVMRDLQGEGNGADGIDTDSSEQTQEPLTEDEVRELLKAAKNGKVQVEESSSGGGRPLDLAKLPPDLQKELADFVNSLSDETKEKLRKRGDARLKDATDGASAALEGRATQDDLNQDGSSTSPSGRQHDEQRITGHSDDFAGIDLGQLRRHVTVPPGELGSIREEFAHLLNEDRGLYHNTVREIAPTINQLEKDLRNIFHKRRQSHRESGRRSGPTLNVNRFIRERSSGKPAVETRPFETKTRPLEKDYAVLLLVDVSGSMHDKIQHAFAATVACTEALTRLKIQHAILGFNDALYPYKSFDKDTEPARLVNMHSDVHTPAARYNNDGWALREAVKTLRVAPEREKLLIVLSDGQPEPSTQYAGVEFDLKTTAQAIEREGRVRLIGLGMGDGTEHVLTYYSNARANIPIGELPNELSIVIKEAIEG